MSKRIYSRIAGTGSYLPEKVLTNDDMSKIVDTSDEWIFSRTGIRERHIAADDQTTGDLAYFASLRAMEAAGVTADEIDLIVIGTTTPDLIFPSTACLLQARLGIVGCGAMDVNAACSGFVYALSVADKFVRSGDAKTVLVVGAETLTRIVDWTDRTTCVLFGDGAGAVILKADEETGILSTHLHADGSKKELLWDPVGVSVGFGEGKNGG
ncbi:ketoacyl-ACP synthase III, partial [Xanthomonas vasicola]